MLIGIDVGGTRTRVGLISGDRVLSSCAFTTSELAAAASAEQFVAAIARAVRLLIAEGPTASLAAQGEGARPRTVGLAIPGLIDRRSGRVLRCVGLSFLEGFAVAEAMSAAMELPVRVMTDAQAATWGEYLACSPRPDRFVHLRLGTGVACGIVIGGQYIPLDEPRTTHAPTLVVDRSATARVCACGLRGCLETVASGRALERLAIEHGPGAGRRPVSSGVSGSLADLQTAWKSAPDGAIAKAIEYMIASVRRALETLNDRFEPEIIVLGGGVMEHFTGFYSIIENSCAASGGSLRLRPAVLGDNAGIIGAAHYAT